MTVEEGEETVTVENEEKKEKKDIKLEKTTKQPAQPKEIPKISKNEKEKEKERRQKDLRKQMEEEEEEKPTKKPSTVTSSMPMSIPKRNVEESEERFSSSLSPLDYRSPTSPQALEEEVIGLLGYRGGNATRIYSKQEVEERKDKIDMLHMMSKSPNNQ